MPRFPSVDSKDLIRFFENKGFEKKRQRGSHVTLGKRGVDRPIVIAHPRKNLHIRHIKNNLKTAGETLAELKRFLGRE